MAYEDDMTLATSDPEDMDTESLDDEPSMEELESEEDALALGDNDILKDEIAAVRDDTLSEPEHFVGPNEDSGNFDDANWQEAEVRRGAGDTLDEEDLGELGFHEERFTDAIDGGSSDEDL